MTDSVPAATARIAVITGGSRGIGEAIALQLARAGNHIVIVDRTGRDDSSVARAIRHLGRQCHHMSCDIASPEAVESLGDRVRREVGSVSILVNNAGVTRDNIFLRLSAEDWDTVLSTNLRGTFLMTKTFARDMMKQRFGRIVNITSVVGLTGNRGQANYAASKAGIIGFTKSVAKELAERGITVNAVAPGYIETAMTAVLPESVKTALVERIPMSGLGRPEDVAHAVAFLASDEARYITGQVLAVDGGMVMS